MPLRNSTEFLQNVATSIQCKPKINWMQHYDNLWIIKQTTPTLKTSEILKVSSHFNICIFVQISRNLGFFASWKMCYILGNTPSTFETFLSIVCIILSSAHIKSFIYFSLSIPAALKWARPKMSKIVILLWDLGIKILWTFWGMFFFKVSSNSCMDFIS